MSHYHQRRSSLNTSQGQDYDYNTSRVDGRIPYGPSSLPSRPVDPQGEHAVSRKYYDSFSNVGIKATNATPSPSAMSDLEKLRALKKAIMDGQIPSYNTSPKPQALEALYTPRAHFTDPSDDHKTDTSYQHETRHTLDNQGATRSFDAPPPRSLPQTSTPQVEHTTAPASPQNQEISGSKHVNDVPPPPTVERPATPPLTDNPTQSVTIPQAADETEAASPTSMIMSPTEPRLIHQSSIIDMEIDSPPPSAAPPPVQDDGQSNPRTVPPTDSENPEKSAQSDRDTLGQPEPNTENQAKQPPTLSNPRTEHRSDSGSPVITGLSHPRNVYPDEPRRHDESRNFDYRSQPPYPGDRRSERSRTETERTDPQSLEFHSQRGYRRGSSPDSRYGPSGPPRPPNDGRRYHYESRFPSNRSPPRSSVPEPKGYDSRLMDGGRVMPREPYPGPPGDRSSASARNYPYDREPSRFRDTVDERRHSTLSESSDPRVLDQNLAQRRLSDGQRNMPPVPNTGNLPGAPPPRTSEGSRYAEERGSKYVPRPDFYPPTPPNVPPGTGRSLPFEPNSGLSNIRTDASDDGEIGRRSTTPRSVGESAGTRPSIFIPGRVPEGLPSRPPPTVEEPLTPRSSLMPDRIAPEPPGRSYVPLAARLTSPNDYAQRGRGGPPPNPMRGPVDDFRYSSPIDHDSWSPSGRIDEPLRRDTGYSRPDDTRDYSRIVPRPEWDRSRSPPVDHYGIPVSSRPPYGRDRSLSPPRRSGNYPRSGYPDVDDNRGSKRPRQDLPDPDYRRPTPLGYRMRDDFDPRAPLPPPPPPPAYPDPRGPYTRPPPPDAYRSYDRDSYPADSRSRPPPLPYGNDRDRYPPDAEWSGRPYRR